tara:strand:- start:236 stop:913 length:678 start_codon:yes stop_codon:yes gene_type:complete
MAIVHKTRTQLVVEAIREKILSGEIKAGEALRQAALAEDLNVSRIPVREALLQLEAEGLVNFEAHKGATASEVSSKQVDEVFELRALLEAELLKYSMNNLSDADFARAEEVLLKLNAAVEAGDSMATTGELNTQFHNMLYCRANRPHTADLVSTLNKVSNRYVRMHIMLSSGFKRAPFEHGELLSLCRQGKIKPACDFLKKHILGAKDDVKNLLIKMENEQALID